MRIEKAKRRKFGLKHGLKHFMVLFPLFIAGRGWCADTSETTDPLLNLFILPAFYLRFGRSTGALTDSLTVPGAVRVSGSV